MKNIKTRFAPHFLLVLGMASNLLHAQPPPAIPMLNSPLVPEFVAPGSAALTLTLNGSDFGTGSIVYWNGSPRPTSAHLEAPWLPSLTPRNCMDPLSPTHNCSPLPLRFRVSAIRRQSR